MSEGIIKDWWDGLHASQKRWVEVLSMGVIGGPVAAFIVLLLRTHEGDAEWTGEPTLVWGQSVVETLGSLPPFGLVVLLLTVAGLWLWVSGLLENPKRWRLRFLRAYPPLLLSIAIGYLMLIACFVSLRDFDALMWLIEKMHASKVLRAFRSSEPWHILVTALTIGLFMIGLDKWLEHRHVTGRDRAALADQKLRISTTARPISEWTYDEIVKWAMSDEEPNREEEVLFEHPLVADRIASRLRRWAESQGPKTDSCTMALIGEAGAGKSTICKLVKRRLESVPSIRIVTVSLWPFDSAEAAVRGILQSLIDELGHHTSTLALRGIPEAYVSAMEGVTGLGGGLSQILRGETEPGSIIDKVDKVATALGLKIVLWIEDAERFTGGSILEGEAKKQREEERLGPIRALLYLLDRRHSITVLVADVSLDTRFDLHKIARFVEQTPKLCPADVWGPLDIVRSTHLNPRDPDFMDPADASVRAELNASSKLAWMNEYLNDTSETFYRVRDAIPRLVGTPRQLKVIIRLTVEQWRLLTGEIDHDSVLIGNLLRVVYPELLSFIGREITILRDGFDNAADKANSRYTTVATELHETISSKSRVQRELRSVVEFLFPNTGRSGANKDLPALRPQGFASRDFTDYWRRWLAEKEIASQDSDQRILRSMRDWRIDKQLQYFLLLSDERLSSKLLQFHRQWTATESLAVFEDVCGRLIPCDPVGWTLSDRPAQLETLWQILMRRRPSGAAVKDALRRMIEATIDQNLPLTYAVMTYLAPTEARKHALLEPSQLKSIYHFMQAALVRTFGVSGGWKKLQAALRGGDPLFVYHLCMPLFDETAKLKPRLFFRQWARFAKVLLDFAENTENEGRILVAFLLIYADPARHSKGKEEGQHVSSAEEGWMVDTDFVNQLFPLDRVAAIFADWAVPGELTGQLENACNETVEWAIRWQEQSATEEETEDGEL